MAYTGIEKCNTRELAENRQRLWKGAPSFEKEGRLWWHNWFCYNYVCCIFYTKTVCCDL